MKTIEIKNRFTDELIYSFTSENATIKDALIDAIQKKINLSNADLSNADLSGAFKVPIYCKWSHGITNGNLIHIGCEKRTIMEWDEFFESDEIIQTKRNTNEFKQIQAVYEAYRAYLTFLNK